LAIVAVGVLITSIIGAIAGSAIAGAIAGAISRTSIIIVVVIVVIVIITTSANAGAITAAISRVAAVIPLRELAAARRGTLGHEWLVNVRITIRSYGVGVAPPTFTSVHTRTITGAIAGAISRTITGAIAGAIAAASATAIWHPAYGEPAAFVASPTTVHFAFRIPSYVFVAMPLIHRTVRSRLPMISFCAREVYHVSTKSPSSLLTLFRRCRHFHCYLVTMSRGPN